MSDERINDKLDVIKQDIHDLDINVAVLNTSVLSINKTLEEVDDRLGEYNSHLEIHIAATMENRRQNDLLQQELALFKLYIDGNLKLTNEKLTELEKPAVVIKGVLWVVAALTAVLGLVFLIKDLL